jgi:hypothetical protein
MTNPTQSATEIDDVNTRMANFEAQTSEIRGSLGELTLLIRQLVLRMHPLLSLKLKLILK